MAAIVKTYDGETVRFDADGYLHATPLAKKYGKRLDVFMRSPETADYVAAVASSHNLREEDLIRAVQGSRYGTRLHPKLAVFFARWLDPKFAVWCDAQIDDIVRGKSIVVPVDPPKATNFDAIRFAVDLIRDIPGVDHGMLGAAALRLVQKETGADLNELRLALPSPTTRDLPENPTQIGKRIGERMGIDPIGPRTVNKLLERAGLQFHNGEKWVATPTGERYSTLKPYQNDDSGHSDWQLLWFPTVAAILEMEVA